MPRTTSRAVPLTYHPVPDRPPGRRLVVSDIHGCARTFTALLDRIRLKRSDHLFLLGDLINKGPASARVLDRVLALLEDGYTVFALRGNHEQRLIAASLRGPKAVRDLARRQPLTGLVDRSGAVRPRYLRFLQRLPCYVALDDYLLVHAGFDFDAAYPFRAWRAMLTIRNYPVDTSLTRGRPIIHGHHPHPLGEIRECLAEGGPTVPLDNGCVYAHRRSEQGHLLCLNLDDQTLWVQPNVERAR